MGPLFAYIMLVCVFLLGIEVTDIERYQLLMTVDTYHFVVCASGDGVYMYVSVSFPSVDIVELGLFIPYVFTVVVNFFGLGFYFL